MKEKPKPKISELISLKKCHKLIKKMADKIIQNKEKHAQQDRRGQRLR